MKRALHVLALSLLAFLPASTWADDLFPDKNLEKVVRQQIFEKRGKEEPLVEADVQNVSILSGKGKGITNLAGLEKCKNLLAIDLENNEIADLEPLKGLTLVQQLNLAGNKITSAAPLAELKKLQYLDLHKNQISDVAPLADLKALQFLDLADNQIKDIAPLAGLAKVHALYLTNNPVADFAPLAQLKNIERLDLRGTGIKDLAPLADLKEWQRHLFLHNNQVTDLSVLVAMAKKDFEGEKRFAPFWEIWIGENPLSEDAKTKQVEELKKYGVDVHTTWP
jgi:internalin A